MKFWANISKRVPIRAAAPTLLVALALAGIIGRGAAVFRGIVDLVGQYWG